MESRDGWRRGCWRNGGVSDLSGISSSQEGRTRMADGSYALGLFAERVLLLAKLGFEEEAVKVGGIGRGGLLCKSTCH